MITTFQKAKTNFPLSLSDYSLDLQLLDYTSSLVVTEKEGNRYIFDPIRKKYLILQPEEIVRQLLILWFISKTIFSRNAIQVEKLIKVNQLKRRFDILIYDKKTHPLILIECKAPDTTINQSVFDQISAYNLAMKAPFLMVTNGHSTWFAHQNLQEKKYQFFNEIPTWMII